MLSLRKQIEANACKITKLRATAAKQNRDLTAEEIREMKDLIDQIDSGLVIFDRVEQIQADENEARKVGAPFLVNTGGRGVGSNPGIASPISAKPRTLGAHESKAFVNLFGSEAAGKKEWTDETISFFGAVMSGRHHPGLIRASMGEGTDSGGGFLVPVENTRNIHDISLENEIVMPRSSVVPMTSNALTIPGFVIGDHSSSLYGGFTASYKPEAGTLTEANPTARDIELVTKKLTGFIKGSNDLANDMVGGVQKLEEICGKGLGWYRDRAFLKGSGAGQPLGILNGSCLITVDKESGQQAATIQYENLTNMVARLWSGSFQNSVWICHQSTIPQLLSLVISVGTGGAPVPVMSESNGQFKILTRPVIFTEKTETLGSKGDILLADFSQYVIGLRQGMRFDLSPHVYFTTDQFAARLIERHDGQPLWGEALTLADGSTTVSPFVTLAARE